MEYLQTKEGYIDPLEFDAVYDKLYNFFRNKKGFRNAHAQSSLNIMAACEDPSTIGTFFFNQHNDNLKFPLPQTTQMNLEVMMMARPNENGFFSTCTSYRNEPNPVPGRHMRIFPLVDFETKGNMDDLIQLERELLEYLGYGNRDSFKEIDYEEACKLYGVDELEHEHEEQLCKDFGSVVFLKNFPNRTSPFWNMKQHPDGKGAYKVDVILDGQETIGSAERSSNVDEMKKMFTEISDGEYAKILYDQFTTERVDEELNDFYNLNFIDRCGGGIGVSRLIRSMKLNNLL